MICKKCGEQLAGNYTYCPKCGNKIVQKKGIGKIVVLLSVLLVVVGVGGYFFMSRNMQQSEPAIVENAIDENVEIAPETIENNINEDIQDESKPAEEVDEMEEFFLSLSFEPLEMIMGETHQIQLEKKMIDAVWVSSDEEIVQVADGVVKALTPGTATITVSLEENQKFFDVVVNPFSDMTLAVNCSKTMELSDIMSNVRWESSAPEIVSVSEGTINSLSSGASVITAYIDEVPYSFEVVATTPDISASSVRKIIGNTQQISILGTNGQVEWKSDNTAVATVTETGLITLEPTGAGQSTVVHAYVDGMEFKIDVEAEPIPQLSSTYKIYGYQNDETYKNARITLCANANEIARLVDNYGVTNSRSGGGGIIEVLNVADADYSDGRTYPVYRTYMNQSNEQECYTEIYLLGTSQKANVLLQQMDFDGSLRNADGTIIYEENDGYGVIKIYCAFGDTHCDVMFVTISIDGYVYELILEGGVSKYEFDFFNYSNVDNIPLDYIIEECSVDEIITHQATDSSVLVANSRTYHTNNDWVERIGTKFVAELEDQAIEMVAGAVLKLILPF